MLQHRNRSRRVTALRCSSCLSCSTCKERKKPEAFHESNRTCKYCSVELQCKGCLKILPQSSFDANAIKNSKRIDRKSILVCLGCRARYLETDKKIKDRNAWKCTCPGQKSGRFHIASNEKCKLFPRQMGEQRWPGKNVNVSREDAELWQRVKFHNE